jgi:hypothetical protein
MIVSALVEVKVVKMVKGWLERLGLSYVCYALEYIEASFRRTRRLTRGSKNSNQIRGQSVVDYQAKGPRPLVQD